MNLNELEPDGERKIEPGVPRIPAPTEDPQKPGGDDNLINLVVVATVSTYLTTHSVQVTVITGCAAVLLGLLAARRRS